MSAELIKILIVDDIAITRSQIADMLSTEADFTVVGEAESGFAAIETAAALQPDIVLIDVNMPDMDGIIATEKMLLRSPNSAVILISVNSTPDYVKRGMHAGAKDYLEKPFNAAELHASVRAVDTKRLTDLARNEELRRLAAPARPAGDTRAVVAAISSARGGVGRTMVAINLAIGAAVELGEGVVLVDGHLQFGDIGMLLNLDPKLPSIADICKQIASEAPEHLIAAADELLERHLVVHPSGVRVLLAPQEPVEHEYVTEALFRLLIERLRLRYRLIVIDLPPQIDDRVVVAFDAASLIYLVGTSEFSNIRGLRLLLTLFEGLGYGKERTRLVLNRADLSFGIGRESAEKAILHRPFDYALPSDLRATTAANSGVAFLVANPKTPLGGALSEMGVDLARFVDEQAAAA